MVDRERGINGVGTAGAYPTAAWSANGDICASSRIADRLVGSSPTATVCMWWVYVVDPTNGPPLLVGGGAKYVRGVRLASSIASSSARARACHSYVELRSDRKLWRLLAEKGSPVDCTGHRSSSSELTDCNSFCFFICLRCLRMRIKRPPRARLATTPAMMTPAAALGCERNLERSLRSIFQPRNYCDLRWVLSWRRFVGHPGSNSLTVIDLFHACSSESSGRRERSRSRVHTSITVYGCED